MRIYLIVEFNCYETEACEHPWIRRIMGLSTTRSTDRRSLWLATDPYDPNEDDYTKTAVKIIGPTYPETVEGLALQLRQLFDRAGFPVIEEAAADD